MSPNMTSQIGLWLVCIVNLALILVIYRQFGLSAMSTAQGHDNDGLRVGEVARPLQVQSVWDAKWHTEELAGHWSMVLFSTPHCEPCVEAMAHVDRESKRLREYGIEAVTVLNATQEQGLEYQRESPISTKVVVDPAGECSQLWDVKVTPFAFLIDPDGVVRDKMLVGAEARVNGFIERSIYTAATTTGTSVFDLNAVSQPRGNRRRA